MIGLIYHAFDTVTGKAYVGQTWQSLAMRKSQHRRSGRNAPFQNVLRKRPSTIVWTVLLRSQSQDELDAAETAFIRELDTFWPNGYNLRAIGKGGRLSELARANLSRAHVGLPGNRKGQKATAETIERLRASHRGKRHPDSTRVKMSASHIGMVHSEETKQRISKANLGKKRSAEQRERIARATSEGLKKWWANQRKETL